MDKKESSAIISNIERENADNKTEAAFELRKKHGLPLNATTNDVFIKLAEPYNLPNNARQMDVVAAMIIDLRDGLVEVQADFKKDNNRPTPLGRLATLLSLRK